jgi:hypothetical protein
VTAPRTVSIHRVWTEPAGAHYRAKCRCSWESPELELLSVLRAAQEHLITTGAPRLLSGVRHWPVSPLDPPGAALNAFVPRRRRRRVPS